MLDELIRYRDGTFNLSNNMSDRDDIEHNIFFSIAQTGLCCVNIVNVICTCVMYLEYEISDHYLCYYRASQQNASGQGMS